jgi:hypothetical protein
MIRQLLGVPRYFYFKLPRVGGSSAQLPSTHAGHSMLCPYGKN